MDGIDLAVWSGGYVDVMEQKGREREEEGSSLFACGIKSLSENSYYLPLSTYTCGSFTRIASASRYRTT